MWTLLLLIMSMNGDQVERLQAGGKLSMIQQAMDIQELHLALTVEPDQKTIAGFARLNLLLEARFEVIELDLVDTLTVSTCEIDGEAVPFRHTGHKLFIDWPEPRKNDPVVTVHYAGRPWEATDPPWEGGFNWDRTDSGQPWVGVSCQSYGAKVWFPSKNHPADKIQGLTLEITVPKPLYCATNGLLEKITPVGETHRTFHWKSRYPVAAYNVSINVADYTVEERTYSGKKDMPVILYALREHQKADQVDGDDRTYEEKKTRLLEEAVKYLEFFAKHFGEYPFIDEKFGIAHTAYYGMEHQTINSYGNNFRIKDGYDFLLFHEMVHEWWGNKVTNNDWAHFWIHEGIGTYASGMYLEEIGGEEAMVKFFEETSQSIANKQPLVPKSEATTGESYTLDVYNKGAMVIHALRWLIGKETTYKILREVANTPRFTYNNTIDTDDFIAIAEKVSGKELDWFFRRYLYVAKPPKLSVFEEEGQQAHLAWGDPTFTMPLEVELIHGDRRETIRLEMPNGKATLTLPEGADYTVDPKHWVYMTVEFHVH